VDGHSRCRLNGGQNNAIAPSDAGKFDAGNIVILDI
jgi:hypothetical protein